MRKYIVHTKNDTISIVEVEGEIISGTEDPTILWLPNHEFMFRIIKPVFLYEPSKGKDKTMVPPVYHSHSIYHTAEQARSAAEGIVRSNFEFDLRKHGTQINYAEVFAKCKEIKEVLL